MESTFDGVGCRGEEHQQQHTTYTVEVDELPREAAAPFNRPDIAVYKQWAVADSQNIDHIFIQNIKMHLSEKR